MRISWIAIYAFFTPNVIRSQETGEWAKTFGQTWPYGLYTCLIVLQTVSPSIGITILNNSMLRRGTQFAAPTFEGSKWKSDGEAPFNACTHVQGKGGAADGGGGKDSGRGHRLSGPSKVAFTSSWSLPARHTSITLGAIPSSRRTKKRNRANSGIAGIRG